MSSKVVLILGAGQNIGKSLIQKFSSNGFKVAIASRTLYQPLVEAADVSVKADFANPSSIKSIFSEVVAKIGTPNVVIYNAGAVTFLAKNPLSTPLSKFETDLAVNISSVYAAAQEAVAGFDGLPKETLKQFIFTGNRTNIEPIPIILTLSVGKSGASHLIWSSSLSYKDSGYQFYYADERKPDGTPIGSEINGEATAEHYYGLSEKNEQGPWLQTFVAGKGFVDFQR